MLVVVLTPLFSNIGFGYFQNVCRFTDSDWSTLKPSGLVVDASVSREGLENRGPNGAITLG